MKAQLLMLKGIISDMPEDDKRKVETAARELREVICKHGDSGVIALALVGLENSED